MRKAREQDGIALVSSLIVLLILFGLGFALITYTNGQQRASYNEARNETAFSLAEAALNAQIFELSVQWPTSAINGGSYPTSCNAASNGAGYCPDPRYLSPTYPSNPTSCPSTAPRDAWNPNSSPSTSGWTTYVRDAGSTSTTQSFFNSTWEQTQPAYDTSLNGALWVRAVGTVNCQTAVVVSKVTAQYVGLNFPNGVLIANGFETGNNGNGSGPILDTKGSAAQAGAVQMRCNGLGNKVGPGTTCTSYRSGQVSPDTTTYAPTIPTQALTAQQLLSMKVQAKANGTYWASGQCPSSVTQLTGTPTYIEGPCTLSFSGNGSANSASSPGFLLLYNGTIEVTGTSSFYGEIYAVNAHGCPPGCLGSGSDVVYVHGNGHIYGGIVVDGNGTVNVGDSHKGNFTYDPTSLQNAKTWGGAAMTLNSFRQLPAGQ